MSWDLDTAWRPAATPVEREQQFADLYRRRLPTEALLTQLRRFPEHNMEAVLSSIVLAYLLWRARADAGQSLRDLTTANQQLEQTRQLLRDSKNEPSGSCYARTGGPLSESCCAAIFTTRRYLRNGPPLSSPGSMA